MTVSVREALNDKIYLCSYHIVAAVTLCLGAHTDGSLEAVVIQLLERTGVCCWGGYICC